MNRREFLKNWGIIASASAISSAGFVALHRDIDVPIISVSMRSHPARKRRLDYRKIDPWKYWKTPSPIVNLQQFPK